MRIVDEFKEFIARGNVMDMAVGIIVGGAFTGIVNSLVNDIITPVIQLVTGGNALAPSLVVAGINFGGFIGQVINFLIIALVVFLMIKGINAMRDKVEALAGRGDAPVEEVAAPHCPYCLEEVKEGATRCPHCGAEIKAA
ncbi:MAG TPA: large conductance mechanosensitive channel protein MscL [Candidatus Olsenella stercoravium]|uniref:Large-conductance mechanosensitive channel n=1 Tax=Candidatus Olsenella stercoravium TaxID=2838713 RepID=A0A9D2DJ05_9ACTN|nr:large conductance mechanosensitive channel protein MscL [Candidatus Olsenella stercoravium]